MSYRPLVALASFFAVSVVPPLAAQEVADAPEPRLVQATAESLAFGPLELPGFDSGMQLAVLSGDPASAGPYVLRLSFPDGYEFPAHFHPMAENLTVLEGRFHLGMGTEVGPTEEYGPGDFLFIPAEHPHFGGATGHTVVQLHGEGPFQVMLAEPGD